MTHSFNKLFLVFGAVFGLLAVLFGAFGAHWLSNLVTSDMLQTYETGVRFQFFHAFALLSLGILGTRCPPQLASWAGSLFGVGIIIFSGSLYLITAINAANSTIPLAVGLLTPLGGVLLILGWALLIAAVLKIDTP